MSGGGRRHYRRLKSGTGERIRSIDPSDPRGPGLGVTDRGTATALQVRYRPGEGPRHERSPTARAATTGSGPDLRLRRPAVRHRSRGAVRRHLVAGRRQLPVHGHVVVRHPGRPEPILEHRPAPPAIQVGRPADRVGGGVDRVHHEPGHPVVDHLGDRTGRPGDDRGAAGHRLDHHQPERLGPVDREQHGPRPAEERPLLRLRRSRRRTRPAGRRTAARSPGGSRPGRPRPPWPRPAGGARPGGRSRPPGPPASPGRCGRGRPGSRPAGRGTDTGPAGSPW